MKSVLVAIFTSCLSAQALAETTVSARLTGSAASVDGAESWTAGGLGKLLEEGGRGELRLGIDAGPAPWLALHLSGAARASENDSNGGLTEAWVRVGYEPRPDLRVRLKAGSFFLPTSRENVEALWFSPYTSTPSAINSWIGEEIRPTAVECEVRAGDPSLWHTTVAVTALQGTDSAGSLLAWRGWSLGSRLSAYGEVVALPPIDALNGIFTHQRDDGTKPIGRDLDGRTGWSARLRTSAGDRFTAQWLRYDNRGDRQLHRGEYAWETSYDSFALEVHHTPLLTVAAEWLGGETGMGPGPAFPAQLDLAAAYVLASIHPGRHQITLRHDRFETEERDHHPSGDLNDEEGSAWTAGYRVDLTESLQLGAEWLELDADRAEAARLRGDESLDGRSVLVEVIWRRGR
jgi:hypothetical protein